MLLEEMNGRLNSRQESTTYVNEGSATMTTTEDTTDANEGSTTVATTDSTTVNADDSTTGTTESTDDRKRLTILKFLLLRELASAIESQRNVATAEKNRLDSPSRAESKRKHPKLAVEQTDYEIESQSRAESARKRPKLAVEK